MRQRLEMMPHHRNTVYLRKNRERYRPCLLIKDIPNEMSQPPMPEQKYVSGNKNKTVFWTPAHNPKSGTRLRAPLVNYVLLSYSLSFHLYPGCRGESGHQSSASALYTFYLYLSRWPAFQLAGSLFLTFYQEYPRKEIHVAP